MGILDKFKNLFIEDEEPIKSEVIQVEIPSPVKEEKKVEVDVADTAVVKNQEKVTTPIFFDDDYFKELEQPKQQPKREVKSSYLKEPKKEEKKHFKPTPIISPIYGVLDKNYNKEDITTKKERNLYHTNNDITIDEVRNKAFGTLEDDLEDTLFGKNSILFNNEIEDSTDLFDELTEDVTEDVVIKEEIDIVEDDIEERGITESELFDLIDSMYEKGE